MAPHPAPHTLTFEDLPLGGEWSTRGRTVTEADLAAYISMAGDFNPLYADAAYARTGPQAGVVLPGSLIAAVTLGLGAIDVPLPQTVALVGMHWSFVAPARPGDTLYSHWRLGRKRPVQEPEWGLGVWQIEVVNQEGATVAKGEVARLVVRREPLPDLAQPSVPITPEPAAVVPAEPSDRPDGGAFAPAAPAAAGWRQWQPDPGRGCGGRRRAGAAERRRRRRAGRACPRGGRDDRGLDDRAAEPSSVLASPAPAPRRSRDDARARVPDPRDAGT